MDKKYICYCGLYCENCAVKVKVEPASKVLYEEMKKAGFEEIIHFIPDGDKFWSFLKSMAVQGVCISCKEGSGNPGCAVRICSKEKNVEMCALCERYPCEKFAGFFESYPILQQDNSVLREKGMDAWAKLQGERRARGFTYADEKQQKKALIIIDIQNDYFEGGANPLIGSLEASINAKRILEDFREKSLPVIHIQHFSTREGSTFFIPNTKGVEIHENVAPVSGEKVIAKNYPNSFRETDLLDYLKSTHITDLVICGMMTHICVDATTRAAKDYGFTCEVIGNACATKDLEIQGKHVAASEVQKSFLAALNYFYSTVKDTLEE